MRGSIALVLAAATAACLPGDERPPPARVFVTAEPNAATTSGFATEDGWTVVYERFVTALGDVDLEGANDRRDGPDGEETCNDYSQTNYEWLIDFTVAGREKVALLYGLGDCGIEYRMRGPSDDAVVGAGATEADREAMAVEATDDWAEEEETTLFVQGTATSATGEVKSFAWTFRRSYEIARCAGSGGEKDASATTLESGGDHEVELEVRGEELFRRTSDDAAPLVFEPYAAADADGDGQIELAELAEVDVPEESLPVPRPPGLDEDEEYGQPETLADLVYSELLPRITRVAGAGACETELRDRR